MKSNIKQINAALDRTYTIEPSDIRDSGAVEAVNQATALLRNRLMTLAASHSGELVNFHLAVAVEPLTDSAGKPLMTRGKPGE